MDRELTTYIDRHFETVDQRFEKVDERFDRIDQRFEKVDQRFGSLEHQIDERGQKTEQSLREVHVLIEDMDSRLLLLTEILQEVRVDGKEFRREMNDRFVGFENLLQLSYGNLDRRLTKLESPEPS